MAAKRAGKDARRGDRHKDVEARRAYMRDYMRDYMRKRRAFGQPTVAKSDLRFGVPAKPAERTAAPALKPAASPINPAMGPLHADFVAEHNRTGGFLRPA
jgi:hypothetical protein